MRSDTFERALRRLCRRKPFKPFAVEMMTGELLRVVHPEAMVVRQRMVYFFEPDDERRFFDASSVSQLFQPRATGNVGFAELSPQSTYTNSFAFNTIRQ